MKTQLLHDDGVPSDPSSHDTHFSCIFSLMRIFKSCEVYENLVDFEVQSRLAASPHVIWRLSRFTHIKLKHDSWSCSVWKPFNTIVIIENISFELRELPQGLGVAHALSSYDVFGSTHLPEFRAK